MQKYVALLRGINVSGQKKIPMKELREAMENAGLLNVETYIQSGNVLFDVNETDERDLTEVIEESIREEFSFDVPTLVLPQEIFGQVIRHNPFLDNATDTKKLYVGFMYDQLDDGKLEELAAVDTGEDSYKITWPFIFMKFGEGIGKSKMDNNFFERKLKTRATTRNWNTILKLAGET